MQIELRFVMPLYVSSNSFAYSVFGKICGNMVWGWLGIWKGRIWTHFTLRSWSLSKRASRLGSPAWGISKWVSFSFLLIWFDLILSVQLRWCWCCWILPMCSLPVVDGDLEDAQEECKYPITNSCPFLLICSNHLLPFVSPSNHIFHAILRRSCSRRRTSNWLVCW